MTNVEYANNNLEQEHIAHRLQERERFLRTLIGNLPGVVYRCRTDEQFTSEFISDGCIGLTGYNVDDFTRERTITWDEIIHGEDRDRIRAEIKNLLKDPKEQTHLPFEFSYRIINRSGELKYVHDRFRFINDEKGNIIALEGFITDVTKRTLDDERIRVADARYRLLAENMCDLVCLHAPNGHYQYVSPSSLALLGYAPEELIDKSPYDFIHEEEIVCVRDDTHERLLKGENDLMVTYRMRRKTGEYIWLETMAQTVKDKIKGEITQLLTVSRDITKRKQAEDKSTAAQEEIARVFFREQSARHEADRAHREADHANYAKDEFLQLISHEFRTPLTTIKMLARLMQQGGETAEEKHEYLETIAAECDRQIDMILNLLDVARIDEGKIDLRLEPVDVNSLLKACDKIERHAASARDQKFEVLVEENLPTARGDEKAIRRALCSIIENAIKYTAIGGAVKITARRSNQNESPAEAAKSSFNSAMRSSSDAIIKNAQLVSDEIAIVIEDTGRGIHSEDIPHLFQKFYRGKKIVPHNHTTDGTPDDAMGRAETPGVGLGLYLAKRLIKELGGRVIVTSEVGVGSVFTVYLSVWNENCDKIDLLDEYAFDEGVIP